MSEEGGLGALLGAYNSDSEEQSAERTSEQAIHRSNVDQGATAENAEAQAEDQAQPMQLDTNLQEKQAQILSHEVVQPPPEEGVEDDYDVAAGPAPPPAVSTHFGFDSLPPELANPPPGECNPEVQARVSRWIAVQQNDGRRLTDTLRASRDYRNPEFFKKMVQYWEIDEHGTAFAAETFDPSSLPVEDTLAALQKTLAEENERRKQARAAATAAGTARIDFAKGSSQVESAAAAAQAKALELMERLKHRR